MDFNLVDYDIESLEVNGMPPVIWQELPYGVEMIRSPYAWNQGYRGQGVVVAVVDTGIDFNHSDLVDRVIGGYNFTTDYNGDPTNYFDNNGHGTHCAGTICATHNDTGVIGVAPEASVLAVKVLNSEGSGTAESIIAGIEYATNWVGENGERVNIISLSLGSPIDFDELHQVIINAVNQNILVVCAAGNDRNGVTGEVQYMYPGAYPEVVEVGACNSIAEIAPFSNQNNEVDLVAPGVGIKSTFPGNQIAYLSGTSMATPHVAGCAALIINEWKRIYNRTPSEAQLYAQIVKKCTDLGVDPTLQGNGLILLINETKRPSIDEVDIVTAAHFLGTQGVIDSPDFWINLANKYKDDPNSDLRNVELLIRKFSTFLM